MTRREAPNEKNRRALDELQDAVNATATTGGERAKRKRLRTAAQHERDTR